MADLTTVSDIHALNGGGAESMALGSKRQRRPSVRLGDIGEQSAAAAAAFSYEAYMRRTKQWKFRPDRNHLLRDGGGPGKGSKTRPLLTLGNGDCQETLEGEEKRSPAEGYIDSAPRKPKESKGRRGGAVLKRPRTNWSSHRVEEDVAPEGFEEKLTGQCEELREFDREESDSPFNESPLHSQENLALEKNHDRRVIRERGCDSIEHEGIEMEAPSDNTEGREWKCRTSVDRNGGCDRRDRSLEDGVRLWLNGLGLGRYAPVFEIHEVDEEVLPLLTLEDLKDMGINAVGSRRKMFAAIQKFNRGFS